jgi:hypothetical protein
MRVSVEEFGDEIMITMRKQMQAISRGQRNVISLTESASNSSDVIDLCRLSVISCSLAVLNIFPS